MSPDLAHDDFAGHAEVGVGFAVPAGDAAAEVDGLRADKTETREDEAMAEYLGKSEQQKKRAYSPAVITQGGKIVWLAGQTATQDEQGNDISGNFEAQVKTIFSLIDKTLQLCGGSLADMVTMTVFIVDPRHGDRFVEMRAGFFPSGNYPASALITVSNFARPGMLIEIQGVAVIGG